MGAAQHYKVLPFWLPRNFVVIQCFPCIFCTIPCFSCSVWLRKQAVFDETWPSSEKWKGREVKWKHNFSTQHNKSLINKNRSARWFILVNGSPVAFLSGCSCSKRLRDDHGMLFKALEQQVRLYVEIYFSSKLPQHRENVPFPSFKPFPTVNVGSKT